MSEEEQLNLERKLDLIINKIDKIEGVLTGVMKYKTSKKAKSNWKDELRKKLRLETALKGSV